VAQKVPARRIAGGRPSGPYLQRYSGVVQALVPIVPVDRHHREAAGGAGRRRRVTKRTACTGHDRHISAHAISLNLGHVPMQPCEPSRRAQACHWAGERSSSDPGDSHALTLRALA
jgi:hypothetical protein